MQRVLVCCMQPSTRGLTSSLLSAVQFPETLYKGSSEFCSLLCYEVGLCREVIGRVCSKREGVRGRVCSEKEGCVVRGRECSERERCVVRGRECSEREGCVVRGRSK